MNVYLSRPRGFCAGVDRAIDVVKIALDLYGPPVYVRHEIVHNHHVVNDLRQRGAVFVDDLAEVPTGSVLVFSAHGVSPAVRQMAAERKLRVIDATCPLVTKVHLEAVRYARQGYSIILIGHRGHVEVEGTMGEAPDCITLVENPEDVERLPFAEKMVYLTQTTLSVDDANVLIEALRRRFPHIQAPPSEDICYATTNRQAAVKELAKTCQLILVIGSPTSSNSNRLVEVARSQGARSYLIDDSSELAAEMFEGVQNLGVTAGASAPEFLVQEVLSWLSANLAVRMVKELDVIQEDVSFTLPRELVRIARDSGLDQELLAKHGIG
ncbi:MAG TPA: 4-hydroxy-3-methylbut-2-enyl diphosphate reductase [Candidatus Nitrosotenuis sp.]|nr:4-hydroxy-3-methylbut-2-enyl diphosphate reductase [Candidatus Nitrosotenuis sp.]